MDIVGKCIAYPVNDTQLIPKILANELFETAKFRTTVAK